jgi:hypothetical protein
MKINEARKLLDELENKNPDIDVRVTTPLEGVEDFFEELSIRAVLESSAWNTEEVVFKDKKQDR